MGEKLLINDTKSNDEKKQIEEMAKVMCGGCANREECMQCLCADWYRAEKLYNANYRRQHEGEWESFEIPHMIRCSVCNVSTLAIHRQYFNFCPNCGANMKGGTE